MPYDTGDNTDKEFYAGVARLLNVKPETVKRYWVEGFNEFIVRQIYFKGSCRLPYMGRFGIKKIAESIQKQTDGNGGTVVYRVPERYVPVFYPHDTMVNDINMQGVTKQYRLRYKKGALTERDYRRQLRAESVNAEGSLLEEQVEAAKEKFHSYLRDKKKQQKETRKLNADAKESQGG